MSDTDALTRDRTSVGYRAAMTTDWATVTSVLVTNLGSSLVALMAGVTSDTVGRWARGQGGDSISKSTPRIESEQRLRLAYRVYLTLSQNDAPSTVRAWFMGTNPQLAEDSPAERIAEGDYKAVLAAARSFAEIG